MLDKNALLEFFYKGIKSVDNLKIGTEHEKFILNKDTLAPLNYYEKNGILDVFKSLMEYGWLPVTEGEKETIIGLRLNNQSISLEPSGQIELSGKPLNNLHETCDEIHDETCDEISYEEKYDDEFLTHPDTQHDSMFDDSMFDDNVLSDDYLNNVD